ncbi:ras protein [Thozetella sp. PMI_491]|nr:ras protein [Thozetella sp. PMI_491]
MNQQVENYMISILGIGGVGKRGLENQFIHRTFAPIPDPFGDEDSRQMYTIDGKRCILETFRHPHESEYAALRDLAIRESGGFILVYSHVSPASFAAIKEYYRAIEAVKKYRTTHRFIPVVLVGNKSDLVVERGGLKSEGEALAQEFQCSHIETSALTGMNVDEAFYDVVRLIRQQKQLDMGSPTGPNQPPPDNGGRRTSLKRWLMRIARPCP